MWSSFRAVLEAQHVSAMGLTWTLGLDHLGGVQEVPLGGERALASCSVWDVWYTHLILRTCWAGKH